MTYDDQHRVTIAPGVYPGLAEAIEAAGYSWENNNGQWYASDPAKVQQIIASYTPANAVAPLIARVKSLAYGKIVAFLPEWKQSNYNARMNELNEFRFGRQLGPDELAEIEVMRAVWAKAKAIRGASDAHETRLRALTTFSDVAAYNVDGGWPTES